MNINFGFFDTSGNEEGEGLLFYALTNYNQLCVFAILLGLIFLILGFYLRKKSR